MTETISNLKTMAPQVAIVLIFVTYLGLKDTSTRELAASGHEAVHSLAESFSELKETISIQNELMRQQQKEKP